MIPDGLRRNIATAAISMALLAGAGGLVRAQTAAPPAEGALAIGGDVSTGFAITPAELKKLPRTTVVLSEKDGAAKYEGVLVSELLKRAGAPVGQDHAGQALATYVLATAKDGYQVVFSIGEVDPAFTSNDIIVADTIDGKPLSDNLGPLRIVVPHDKHGSRSVRMVQRIDVVRLRK